MGLWASTERPINADERDVCRRLDHVDVAENDDIVFSGVKENERGHLLVEYDVRRVFRAQIALPKTTNETQVGAEPSHRRLVCADFRGD